MQLSPCARARCCWHPLEPALALLREQPELPLPLRIPSGHRSARNPCKRCRCRPEGSIVCCADAPALLEQEERQRQPRAPRRDFRVQCKALSQGREKAEAGLLLDPQRATSKVTKQPAECHWSSPKASEVCSQEPSAYLAQCLRNLTPLCATHLETLLPFLPAEERETDRRLPRMAADPVCG